jgi:UDP-glucose 4-epimerase
MLACALDAGVSHFIYASSGAAYGYHADNPSPLDEDHALRGNPEFAYSDHKRLVEEMLLRFRTEHPELRQLILRPGTILGDDVDSPITAMFERPVIIGVGGTEIPFVLIWDTDVARCIVDGIEHRHEGIFNLAGDGTITLREIARRLHKRYLPVPASVLRGVLTLTKALRLTVAGPEQVQFLSHRPVLSNERIKRELGFTPSMSSEECFERFRRQRCGR